MGEGRRDSVQRLPTGAHGIPSELVSRNQRERLIAAVAEACAEHGYAEISVADLARRARVSTATFYKLFPNKLECALAAHLELSERLLDEVDRSCAGTAEPGARVRAGAATVLELFAADPPTARLLTVEVLALGPAGAARNDETIAAFAARLRAARDDPGGPSPSPNTEWTVIAGIAMLIGKRILAGSAADLPALEEELVTMVMTGS